MAGVARGQYGMVGKRNADDHGVEGCHPPFKRFANRLLESLAQMSSALSARHMRDAVEQPDSLFRQRMV